MVEESELLYNKLLYKFGEEWINQIEIPLEIKDNLNTQFQLRPYQINAFQRFLCYYEKDFDFKIKPTHLLFNMATGSGKTLIMAGLILYLYKKGYRNFIFLVNSKNIIEKTRINFLEYLSNKYLFNKKIEIENKSIRIKEANSIIGTSENDINIVFTTVQKLHGDLTTIKENSLVFDDFKRRKIVFIADEAHHLNASTKKEKEDEKINWEDTVLKALRQNSDNLLLEFTATVETSHPKVKAKYKDKIICKYDLKEFRDDGYSKEIELLESDFDKKERILQALILSEYRRQVAIKNKIDLKPVILFKSKKTIEESKQNFLFFNAMIEKLKAKDILKIKNNRNSPELIKEAFDFFETDKISINQLIEIIKKSFSPTKCIFTNEESLDKKKIKPQDERILISQQHILNSLEDSDNKVRAIFTVNKLNEGWDVLNLFDIVRLYTGQSSGGASKGKIGSSTISEAQLIGRGARYYPFALDDKQDEHTRKFDKDLDNEMRILEEVHYHCHPGEKSRYIAEIKRALKKEGWMDDDKVERHLKLKEDFVKTPLYKKGKVYLNKQIEKDYGKVKQIGDLGVSKRNVKYSIFSGEGMEEGVFKNGEKKEKVRKITNTVSLKKIPKHIIKKAIAKNNFFSFDSINKIIPKLNSIIDFTDKDNFLSGLKIDFLGEKDYVNNLSNKELLEGIIELLNKLEKEIKENISDYEGTKIFTADDISIRFYSKVLQLKKDSERAKGDEDYLKDKNWYVFNANYGTSEEKELVKLMEKKIEKIKKKYQEVYLVRNERHIKIFEFNKGRAFEPDFLLFLKDKEKNKEINYQIFIEPKGEGWKAKDQWKEDFLEIIKQKFKIKDLTSFGETEEYRLIGLPFYSMSEENKFEKALNEELKLEN
jgi:type III restriction enzyme